MRWPAVKVIGSPGRFGDLAPYSERTYPVRLASSRYCAGSTSSNANLPSTPVVVVYARRWESVRVSVTTAFDTGSPVPIFRTKPWRDVRDGRDAGGREFRDPYCESRCGALTRYSFDHRWVHPPCRWRPLLHVCADGSDLLNARS